jgi:uncharacterized cupin superfamily protein
LVTILAPSGSSRPGNAVYLSARHRLHTTWGRHADHLSDPTTVKLDAAPIEPGWIIEGTPQARSRELARSADGTSLVVAWACTAGRFRWHYRLDETVPVISGEVFVTDESGTDRRLGPGDMAFFPAGSRSLWRVPVAVRKLAICRHALPRPLGTIVRAWRRLVALAIGEGRGIKLAPTVQRRH